MKKLIALIITLTLGLSILASCASNSNSNGNGDGTKAELSKINVGYLAGPTGIGMAKLIDDYSDDNDSYGFRKFTKPADAMTALRKGEVDVTCLSTDVAAKFYNQNPDFVVLAINCLNATSFAVSKDLTVNSLADLEGKTIVTTAAGTPGLILEALLEAYGVNATISYKVGEETISSPDKLAPVIKKNQAEIVFAPTHVAYNATAGDSTHKVVLDVNALWNEKFDTPIAMGCIVAKKDYVTSHAKEIEKLLTDYKASIEYISDAKNLDTAADLVVNTTILPALAPAKAAISHLGNAITFIDGDDMKNILVESYKIFGNASIGGKLPDDAFYYKK